MTARTPRTLSSTTRAALTAIPLPGLSDGSGRLAEWGAGIRPDGEWGIYAMTDGLRPTWAGLAAAGSQQAVAMSRAMNARAAGRDPWPVSR